jgi:hypothetical protein
MMIWLRSRFVARSRTYRSKSRAHFIDTPDDASDERGDRSGWQRLAINNWNDIDVASNPGGGFGRTCPRPPTLIAPRVSAAKQLRSEERYGISSQVSFKSVSLFCPPKIIT